MTLIIHRCSCGHPDYAHAGRTLDDSGHPGAELCAFDACRGDHVFGPPELIPSWTSTATGPAVPDPDIAEPGTVSRGLGLLCDCEACGALYRRTRSEEAA